MPDALQPLIWRPLSALPDAHGLAGMFAGVHDGQLLAGGGANFPDRPPWENGTKVWHDTLWAMAVGGGPWDEVGRLPRPLGYGVSISTPDGLVCIGGSDAQRHYADVFRVSLEEGQLEVQELPALPTPLANACGALIADTIYVAGGLETPQSTATLHQFMLLDLKHLERGWQVRKPWPGPPRMLAVAGVLDHEFYLLSGTDLRASESGPPTRDYLRDAYCYSPGVGWRTIASLPRAAVAAPSPTATLDGDLLVLGGDDGAHVGFTPPNEHPGFCRDWLTYDSLHDRWQVRGNTPVARVTAPLVAGDKGFVVVSGEVRPGVRSPEVWSLTTHRETRAATQPLTEHFGVIALTMLILLFAALALFSRNFHPPA